MGSEKLKGRYRLCTVALLVACAGLWAAATAGASGAASTFTIAGFNDGNGNVGCSPPDSNGNSMCPTLRAAVGAATKQANAPTIYLQSGTYQLTPGNGGQLDLASSMDIVGAGPGGGSGTTIQQTDGLSRVVEVDGSSMLSGLEITGGHNSPPWSSGRVAYGGGVLVLGRLNLQNSLVTGNQAIGAPGPASGNAGDGAVGGGIEFASSAAAGSQIVDSTVSSNAALGGRGGAGGSRGGQAAGGGIASETPGSISIQNSTISGNSATGGAGGGGGGGAAGGTGGSASGGGIFDAGSITIAASTIASNAATGGAQGTGPTPSSSAGGSAGGGGLAGSAAGDQLINSTFFGNSSVGGAASTGGTTGSGVGGGISEAGSQGVTIEDDTLAANHASSPPGNLYLNLTALAQATIQDTIVAGGSPDNCSRFGGSPTSRESFNLDDDPADTCSFAAANHDLVGVSPELAATLASNNGPTETLAPAPGSLVLGAGGTCSVSVDQRGEPRPTPCDIGSFESQPPANTILPDVSGKVARGHTLICAQGTWSGDGTLSYSFAWLRNGVLIPGTSTNTYVVGAPDAGQTLACRVTASYYGSTSAASPFVVVSSYPVITVLKASSNPTQVRLSLGCRGPDGARCKGTAVLTVSEKRRGGRVVGLTASARNQVVTVGKHRYSIAARHTATLHIGLNREVAHWLNQFKAVPARLTVNQTTAAGTATAATRHLKIQRPGTSRRG